MCHVIPRIFGKESAPDSISTPMDPGMFAKTACPTGNRITHSYS